MNNQPPTITVGHITRAICQQIQKEFEREYPWSVGMWLEDYGYPDDNLQAEFAAYDRKWRENADAVNKIVDQLFESQPTTV